jgi:YVTN family beta-propeller protein
MHRFSAADVQISPSASNYGSPALPLVNQVTGIIDAPNGSAGSLTPEGLAINPAGTRAYVSDINGGRIDVINTANNSIITKIPIGGEIVGVVINSAGTRVYAANMITGVVSVISTANNRVIDTITIGPSTNSGGPSPYALALNRSGTVLYVVDERANAVSVVNTATDSIVATVPVGSDPLAIAVSPNGSLVYVANGGNGGNAQSTVSVINAATNKVTHTITLGYNAYGVAFNPTSDLAYISNGDRNGNGLISVINTKASSVIGTINLGFGRFPEWIAITPDGTRAYVPDETSGEVSVIDLTTNSLISTFSVGGNPVQVAFINGSEAYVSNQTSGLEILQIFTAVNPVQSVPAQPGASRITVPIPDLNASLIGNGAINSIPPTLSNFINSQSGLNNSNNQTLVTVAAKLGNSGDANDKKHHGDGSHDDGSHDDGRGSSTSSDGDITVHTEDDGN